MKCNWMPDRRQGLLRPNPAQNPFIANSRFRCLNRPINTCAIIRSVSELGDSRCRSMFSLDPTFD